MQIYRILLVLALTSTVVQARRRNRKKNSSSLPGPNVGNHPTHPPNELPSNGDPVNIANQKCEKKYPVSVPSCSPIFFPPQNGDLDITLVTTIECDHGYDLLPNAQREYDCENSGGRYHWNNDTMSCCLKDCNDPPPITDGDRHFSCTVETCEVTYTCDSDYFLNGMDSRTCQSNGQWSGDSPTCTRIEISTTCDDLLKLYADGVEQTLPNGNIFSNIDTIFIDSQTQVIAVHCENTNGPAGIIASMSDGRVTEPSTWKCSNTPESGWKQPGFDDSHWQTPRSFGPNGVAPWGTKTGISPSAEWIWTNDGPASFPTDYNVYCRIVTTSF